MLATSSLLLALLAPAPSGADGGGRTPVPPVTETPSSPPATRRGATIHGRVLGPDGEPRADVAVTVAARAKYVFPVFVGASEERIRAQDRTLADGSFAFDWRSFGPLEIVARTRTGEIALRFDLVLTEAEPLPAVELRLAAPCTLRGTVVDPAGAPVPGLQLAVWPAGSNGFRLPVEWGVAEDTTDHAGRFELNGLPPGAYDVRAADMEEYATVELGEVVVDAPAPSERVTLIAPVTRIRVLLTGTPPPYRAALPEETSGRVRFHERSTRWGSRAVRERAGLVAVLADDSRVEGEEFRVRSSSPGGVHEIAVPGPGEYHVAFVRGVDVLAFERVRITPGQFCAELALDPSAALELGRVHITPFDDDGQPFESAYFWDLDHLPSGVRLEVPELGGCTIDFLSGVAEKRLPAGRYRLSLSPDNFFRGLEFVDGQFKRSELAPIAAAPVEFEVRAGETTEVPVLVTLAAEVVLEVEDHLAHPAAIHLRRSGERSQRRVFPGDTRIYGPAKLALAPGAYELAIERRNRPLEIHRFELIAGETYTARVTGPEPEGAASMIGPRAWREALQHALGAHEQGEPAAGRGDREAP